MSENKFSYYGLTGIPEIPHITDILYATGYVSEGLYYASCHPLCPQYLQNVHLAVATCIYEIFAYFTDKETIVIDEFRRHAKMVIARTIIKMTPDSVPQNNPSLVEAREVLQDAQALVNTPKE